MLAHPIAMALITGGAFGTLFGGAMVAIAMVGGEPVSMGLIGAAVVVGVLVGPPFGFLFMKEMRPLLEALSSGPPTAKDFVGMQWRRDHARLRLHPWFLVLVLCSFAFSLANSIYSLFNAKMAGGGALYCMLGVAVVVMSLYFIALWRSPIPPWRRQ